MNKDVPADRPMRRDGDGFPRPGVRALHATARGLLVARRALHGPLPVDLVHDPALDMLLHLYLAQPEPVAIPALTAGTTVSHGVALHWIGALRGEGLIAAAGGQVALSDAGLVAMEDMLAAVATARGGTTRR